MTAPGSGVDPARLLLIALTALMIFAGVIVRLLPLLDPQRAIASISEDGYLMLTVARNLARGLGMSTSDGTIPTNGVQPLVTLVWAGAEWLVGADRVAAVRLLIVLQFVIAAAAAVCIWRLARRVFDSHPWRSWLAPAAAALWFASPLTITHTTNGLETGPYVLAIVAVLLMQAAPRSFRWPRGACLGACFGALFLVRNDAVFLPMAFLVHGFGQGHDRPLRRHMVHGAVVAVSALAVASPWLAYNLVRFGHIVPISGRAQSLNASFAENAFSVPRVLLEYTWMFSPLPVSFAEPFRAVGAVLLLILFAAMSMRFRDALGLRFDRWVAVLATFTLVLAVYYGLFFGAAYFLSRYLFPISIVTVTLLVAWMAALARVSRFAAAVGVAVLVSVQMIALQREYARGARHPHAQAVEWVTSHLDPATWVGAPQSGLLGYYHDRTINLDGKLNPLAFEARRNERLFRYIVDDTPIEYIVDWYGLARWLDHPETVREEQDPATLTRHFVVIVRDSERNLVVLKRVVPPAAR